MSTFLKTFDKAKLDYQSEIDAFKNAIEEKRKTGILMPFTVSVRKGGRVALTKYPDNYVDPFEPKKKIAEWKIYD